jgi:hypothetical protein
MIKLAGIEGFNSNKDWLKTVTRLDGTMAFTDDLLDSMTEEEATVIATKIMSE